jgi:hypothetical protein
MELNPSRQVRVGHQGKVELSVISRLKGLGIVLAVLGLAFMAAGAFAFIKVQDGQASLNGFSAAQNVTLSYDENGKLGGEEGDAIMALLKNDWKYPVVDAELNPNDPVVNTASEYMYQLATITYHTLNAETTVVLNEDVTAKDGTVYKAGEYPFKNDGRYWTGFDRNNPIEGAARGQIWTATAHALIGELGVGTVTAQALQLGLGLAGLFAGVGFTFLLAGGGLVWATRSEEAAVRVARRVEVTA